MPEFIVTIEADSAPQIVLGQMLLGGTVTALKHAEMVAKYGLSDETIRTKCISINQGTNGKHMYDPDAADAILKSKGPTWT